MTCLEAEPHVSALCDGELIPTDAAEHIRACAVCRTTLADYAQIGTELRVAAVLEAPTLPHLSLPPRRRVSDLLFHRVLVPRFALGALMIAVIAAAASVPIVRAQQSPRWFQFGISLAPGAQISTYRVAKAGYDGTGSSMGYVNGALLSVALRVRVESVSNDDVVLRCRAVRGNVEPTNTGAMLRPPQELPLNNEPAVNYKPGQELAIPIEGGGTVYLKGDVYDNQPKIAFGKPLEPPPNELSMRGPVLTSEDYLLADMSGGSATAQPGWGVSIAAGSQGKFVFALEPFTGAVQGQIEWGQMTFTINSRKFHLVSPAPLAAGVQPRPVWVRYDSTPAGSSIGTVRLDSRNVP